MEDSHYDYLWTLLRNLVNFNALEVMDMNRHDRRALDAIHRKFTEGLLSDVKPYTDRQKSVMAAFLRDVAEKKRKGENTYPRVWGAFGEDDGTDGFVEKVYEAHEGDGKYFKLWGNTFLFKALPDVSVIKTLDFAKATLFKFPIEVTKEPFIALGFAFTAIFQKKRFVLMLDRLMDWMIYFTVNRSIGIPAEDYHRCARELKRAATAVLNAKDWGYFSPLFEKFIQFMVFFLEIDTAYMFRVQDAFADHGLWSGLDTLISREAAHGIGHKWKWIKLALKLTLWRYSEVKEFLYLFFEELHRDRIRMDEGDKYYSLLYSSYNFGGKSKEERYAERKRIDDERGHVFLQM